MAKILLAVSSHDRLGDTGKRTGYSVSEAAHPYYVFVSAGHEVEFVSDRGGEPPAVVFDGEEDDPEVNAFLVDPTVRAKLKATHAAAQVTPSDYAAIFYVGGHGAMWDFPTSLALARLAIGIYEHGGVVAAVCHGPAALINLRLSNGSYLVAGKRVASFSNEEEHSLGLVDVMPFLLEDRLKATGAVHTKAEPWVAHTENDNRVLTGQNPASAAPLARLVVAELRKAAPAPYGLVQVAGIIDQAEADMILQEGADWLGFALRLPAKNEDLSEEDAAAIVKRIQPAHQGVVITYLDDAEEIKAFCAELGFGAIQLHGDVAPAELRKLRSIAPHLFILKSLVVKADNIDELAKVVEDSADHVDMFITDSFNPATGAKGATGLVHDWGVSAELVRISPKPLMLAGGLTPENVAEAIEKVRPAAIDAHTGLEDASGRKDRQKVRTFVAEARKAFDRIAAG